MRTNRELIQSVQGDLESKSGSIILLIILFAFAFILWLYIPGKILSYYGADGNNLTAAEVGDLFGSVSALFAGLAFVGLVWTILQTNREMRLQQRVAMLQVLELEASNNAMAAQADSQHKMNVAQENLAKAQKQMATAVQDLVESVRGMSEQSRQFASQVHTHTVYIAKTLNDLQNAQHMNTYTLAQSTLASLYWGQYQFGVNYKNTDMTEGMWGKFDDSVKKLASYIEKVESHHKID